MIFLGLHPLVVDLDGTLINTDMLHETALNAVRHRPFDIFFYPFWLLKGKAVLKSKLACRSDVDPKTLPYNNNLLMWLQQQKAEGRKLILCTATDNAVATSIGNHLEMFDEVIASDGALNLAGKNKAELLESRFGRNGFDYAGNSNVDLSVWVYARRAVVVNASDGVLKKARKICEVEQVFPKDPAGLFEWRRSLRIHQWLKNLLLFVPILAAHQLSNPMTLVTLILAFFSFSLCASAVYIANDLLDLASDRQHPRKCTRPFAAGRIPIHLGVVVAPLLLLISLGLALFVGKNFILWLVFYFILTCLYSLGLKRVILIDCLILAMLYTLRIVAGAAAVDNKLSFWLLAFSVFLFLSLAFVKRYAELEVQLLSGKVKVHGRGYFTTDAPLIQSLGITSGYASVLVLALYLNSDVVVKLYKIPEFVWGAVPIMLFWISWMWMHAHRGNMHDDPLVFAVKDRASQLVGIAFAVVLGIGSVGLPW